MKIKVIAVNPIAPERSALLGEREMIDENTGLRMSFKQPVSEIQLRVIDGDLIVYLGKPIDVAKYRKWLEEAKKRQAEAEGRKLLNENI